MKRILIIFSLLLCVFAKAQDDIHYYADPTSPEMFAMLHPGMHYRQLKYLYNANNYVPMYDDGHSPFWCGLASAVIPGLGECLNGEFLRGLGKTATIAACYWLAVLYAAGVDEYHEAPHEDILSTTFLLGALTTYIWSIVDAVNIAKVKNMYRRDLQLLGIADVDLYPSLGTFVYASGMVPTAGFTLALTF